MALRSHDQFQASQFFFGIKATIRIGQEIQCLLYAGILTFGDMKASDIKRYGGAVGLVKAKEVFWCITNLPRHKYFLLILKYICECVCKVHYVSLTITYFLSFTLTFTNINEGEENETRCLHTP